MKKLFVCLLVFAMLLSGIAYAKTIKFDGFTISIPDEFIVLSGSDSSCSCFMSDDVTIHIYRYDDSFASIEDAVPQMAKLIMMNDYEFKIENINGLQIAQLNDSFFVSSQGELFLTKGAVFKVNSFYYIISYEKTEFGDNEDIGKWTSMIQSIVVAVNADDISDTPTEEADEKTYDYPTLEKGSKGDEVKTLQQRLVDLYWLDGSVDGDFGNKTKNALERFQEAAGLTVTGIADGKTQATLFADDAPEAELSIGCSSVVIGSYGETLWFVNGQQFKLKGNQTKTLKTPWGTYKFDARGEYTKID